ncbi:MAG: Gfo/Idh/MocA family oxidoreductase [Clostridia bacterium]|nr:Gfo/Idh/MocA family oxidoreductase [Clostridia bacterium]
MLKAGLLGLGTIGSIHYSEGYKEIMAHSGPVSLEACFDIASKNLEMVDGVRKYTDLDLFFENEKENLDMVDICLPTFMHKEVAIKAMRNGFHVLCEKPMALNFKDAKEMCMVSKETGKKLMIAHLLRFQKDYSVISEYIKNETLGKLRNANSYSYGGGLPNGHNGWFKNIKLSGGPIFDVHVHVVDTLVGLLGMPDFLTSASSGGDNGGGYTSISTNLVYDDDFCVNIFADWASPNNRHHSSRCFRFNFENGYIIKDVKKYTVVDNNGNVTEISTDEGGVPFQKEILYFVQSVINNTDLDLCLPDSSANAIRIIEAEIESADNKCKKIMF